MSHNSFFERFLRKLCNSESIAAVSSLILGSLLFVVPLWPADDFFLQAHLFKGTWTGERAAFKEATVMTAASYPALARLKSKLYAPETEQTAVTLECLMDALDLKSLDDYFGFAKAWDGKEGSLEMEIAHKEAAFQFVFKPKLISHGAIELRTVIFKSADTKAESSEPPEKRQAAALRSLREGRLNKILDRQFSMEMDTPVIVGIPSDHGAILLSLWIGRKPHATPSASAPGGKPGAAGTRIETPEAVHTVVPAYPVELREKGVKGQVGLDVAVDEDGFVTGVRLSKSLHPYLDFAAVQALRQYRYQSLIHDGRKVPFVIAVEVNFDPEAYRRLEESNRTSSEMRPRDPKAENLPTILDQCAGYCAKLAGAAINFICEESIKEIHFRFFGAYTWSGIAVAAKGGGSPVRETLLPMWDTSRTERRDYLCDYLFVKRGEDIEERRIVLKDNGRMMPDRTRLLEETRFIALNPVLAVTRILDRNRQPLFNFRLIDRDKIHGRAAYIVEAIPRSGNTWGVEYARIWIDQKSSQVLRTEVQGVPLQGYDDVLSDSSQFGIKPILTTIHVYELEKNGVVFPERSMIRVDYPESGGLYAKRSKLRIDMTYDKYKFFIVETDSAVKK